MFQSRGSLQEQSASSSSKKAVPRTSSGMLSSTSAEILSRALSSQLLRQQNFREHQQRYLAPNPNRKPSQDDLFMMASMLLEPPERSLHHTTTQLPTTTPEMIRASRTKTTSHLHSLRDPSLPPAPLPLLPERTLQELLEEDQDEETGGFVGQKHPFERISSPTTAAASRATKRHKKNAVDGWCLVDLGGDDDDEDKRNNSNNPIPALPLVGDRSSPSLPPSSVPTPVVVAIEGASQAATNTPTSTGAPSPGAAAATITPRDDEQPPPQQAS